MTPETQNPAWDHETPATPDKNTSQPVPDWIKKGGLGLLLLMVLIVIWLVFRTPAHDPMPSRVNIEHDANSLLKTDQRESVVIESAIPVQLPESMVPVNPDLKAMQAHIDQLDLELAENISQHAAWQKQQAVQMTELQDRLQVQARNIQQLEVRRVHQKQPAPKPRPKSQRVRQAVTQSATARRPQPKKAPFALVSIDRWGDDHYAILRHQGQLYEKTPGQSLAGWRVLAVNRDHHTVSVQDSSGRIRELAITTELNR